MHVFSATDNCIDGTSLDAFCAADTVRFDDPGDLGLLLGAVAAVVGAWWYAKQVCQGACASVPAGRAAVDVGFATCHRLRIREAALKAALAALCLWQQAINAFDEGEGGGAGHGVCQVARV
ncbi:hypothetical protein AOT81_07060 [Xylella fastidiosa]|nr:hypothetical protein AOT81_07060 [Xylella fastidiosa]